MTRVELETLRDCIESTVGGDYASKQALQIHRVYSRNHPVSHRERQEMNATEVSGEIIEEVSAQVHESWMDAKRAVGVTTRKLESGEELMVPYAQLSEQAKDLDRGTVRSVLNALPQLGYAIVPIFMTREPV